MEAREDVEHLLRVEHLPPGTRPVYDTNDAPFHRAHAKQVRLAPPWDRTSLAVDELRFEIIRSVLKVKDDKERSGVWGLRPFTLMRAHEVMANRDLCLDAFLVNPEFTPLVEKVLEKPWWGIQPKLFVHYDIPPGEVYGFAQPEYVGVCPIWDGAPGILIHNANGLIWGTFTRRNGV